MARLLSNPVDNFDKIKCKYRYNNKKCETCGFKQKDCECSLKKINVKYDLIEYKRLCCKKNYQNKFDENLKKQFANIYKFPSHDINNFIFKVQISFLFILVFSLREKIHLSTNESKQIFLNKTVFSAFL